MPVMVSCPHCGGHGDVSRAAVGHSVTCANCRQAFPVPPGVGQLSIEWGVGATGTRVPLTPQRGLTLGRATDNDLVLPGAQVSRYHAVIRWESGEWRITDLDSANGTLVDGSRVKTATLATDRHITIGDFVLRVLIVGGGEPHEPQILDELSRTFEPPHPARPLVTRPVAPPAVAGPAAATPVGLAAGADDTTLGAVVAPAPGSAPPPATRVFAPRPGPADEHPRGPLPVLLMVLLLALIAGLAALFFRG
jgi:hypothetical protein